MLKKCFSGLNLTTRRGVCASLILKNTNSTSDSTIDLHIPKVKRENESENQRRARLLYQSRKRGMLENDLLLSTFAKKYLHTFNVELLDQYDKLINEPSNDWDLYYWLTGKEEPPTEFINEVFQLLKEHTQNKEREVRCRQPSLHF